MRLSLLYAAVLLCGCAGLRGAQSTAVDPCFPDKGIAHASSTVYNPESPEDFFNLEFWFHPDGTKQITKGPEPGFEVHYTYDNGALTQMISSYAGNGELEVDTAYISATDPRGRHTDFTDQNGIVWHSTYHGCERDVHTVLQGGDTLQQFIFAYAGGLLISETWRLYDPDKASAPEELVTRFDQYTFNARGYWVTRRWTRLPSGEIFTEERTLDYH